MQKGYENFIYITTGEHLEHYSIRIRDSSREYIIDRLLMDDLGQRIVKQFRVPDQAVKDTIDACAEYISNKITMKTLQDRVDSYISRYEDTNF